MRGRLAGGAGTLVAVAAVMASVWFAATAPAPGGFGRARSEPLEEGLVTQERLDALQEARRAGTLGRQGPIPGSRAPGWAGERLFHRRADDWEPAIAADPKAPYVYILVTRYGASPPGCRGQCPDPTIVLRRSTDGGRSFEPTDYPCTCRGNSGMHDPIIEVVPETGHVYAVWMNDFDVVFSKSTTHGVTWSPPVPTYGEVRWTDKPVLAVSDGGRHVYVAWNGPSAGDAWIAQSHDAGESFTQAKIIDSDRYAYASDADVAPDGTVYVTESTVSYTGPGGAARGSVQHRVLISRDLGATWENRLMDAVRLGEPCVAEGCRADDYYIAHAAVSVDADGDVVYLYDGATKTGGRQRVWSRRSTDAGLSWTPRRRVSSAAEQAATPAIESTGEGSVRAFWYQTNGGSHDAWNVWYRSSSDGGQTWGAAVDISDADGGTAYKKAKGFREIYGDYGELAITSSGRSIAVFGEGISYTGPGGVWFNREL